MASSVAENFDLYIQWDIDYLRVSRINTVWNEDNRHDEILEYIEAVQVNTLRLDATPVDEEIGLRVASNPHITSIIVVNLFGPHSATWGDMIRCLAIRETLIHMTGLVKISLHLDYGMSMQDCDTLFSLLLTSTSLRELHVACYKGCDDDVMSVTMSSLARFLVDSSLVTFDICCCGVFLSQASFTSLCDGVAESTLHTLRVTFNVGEAINLEPAAESLARAISASSLEEITLRDTSFRLALRRTTCVRNLDFALSQIGNDEDRMRINRKWKPLLNANTPLGLWHRILAKAHSLPETSHGPVGILFYLLREKPDLVPDSRNER
jgi:hypothetical protein